MRNSALFSLVSKQGTAAAETCLCQFCFLRRDNRNSAITAAHDDVDKGRGWHDVTDNDACSCTVCGSGSEQLLEQDEIKRLCAKSIESSMDILSHPVGAHAMNAVLGYCGVSRPTASDTYILKTFIRPLIKMAEEIKSREALPPELLRGLRGWVLAQGLSVGSKEAHDKGYAKHKAIARGKRSIVLLKERIAKKDKYTRYLQDILDANNIKYKKKNGQNEQPLSNTDKSRMEKVYDNWKHESGVI